MNRENVATLSFCGGISEHINCPVLTSVRSKWHELGHLQSLPLALVFAAWLLGRSWQRHRRLPSLLVRPSGLFLGQTAFWELMSEG